jgi:hypothetical protein
MKLGQLLTGNNIKLRDCLLGISPESEYQKPTFRNTVSVPSSTGDEDTSSPVEDGTDTVFRNVGF